jgi:replicative DNA helicase
MNNPDNTITPDPTKALPHDLQTEQALLSIVLHKNQTLEDILDFLKEEHFFSPLHQKIFKAVVLFFQRNQLANPITLAPVLKDEADDIANYLFELGSMMIPTIHVRDYGQRVYDFFLRRSLMDLGEEIIHNAGNCGVESPEPLMQIESVERRLFHISLGSGEKTFQAFSSTLMNALQSAETAFKRDSHIIGTTTGLTDVDKLLGGLFPSDLLILAARPSMGKTALATNFAFNAAKTYLESSSQKEGAKVAFFSLEMSAEQLAMRLLGQESGISSDRIRRGAIAQDDFPTFIKISQNLANLPLFIDDSPGLSIQALRTRARRLHRQENIGLIVVDYLQLLTTGHSRSENRVQELSEITRGLKTLAKELSVPVLALSQLSRAVEQRDDKRPQLADLRESGSIEQDADVVMFIYREEYYEARKKPSEGSEKMVTWQKNMEQLHNVAELIIAKQRHGPIATIPLYFDSRRTKFSNFQQPLDQGPF